MQSLTALAGKVSLFDRTVELLKLALVLLLVLVLDQ